MTVLSVLLVQADSWTCAYLQSPDSQTFGRIVPKRMTALDASFVLSRIWHSLAGKAKKQEVVPSAITGVLHT